MAVSVLLTVPGQVFGQRGGRSGDTIEIRVASPLPRNSDWGRTLDRIAGEWTRVSGGSVQARIIHDGLEGGETRMLSSLASNNIQAALFTSMGLAEIIPEVMNLSVPFNIRDDDELEVVLAEILPFLESRAEGTGFVVLAWSKAGWVNIFSRDPVFEPNDLRRMRVATSAEAEDTNAVFRNMGFTLVESELTNLGTMLANNTVNAIYQSPAAVAPLGLHRHLNNMLDLPVAPFMGGLVLNRVTWNRLGPDMQKQLMDVTRRIAADFDAAMPRTVANAVTTMQRGGLRVNAPDARQQALWHDEARRALPSLLGTAYDRAMHERINGILERHRNGR